MFGNGVRGRQLFDIRNMHSRGGYSHIFAIRGRAAGQGRVFCSTGLRQGIDFMGICLK